MTKTKKSYQSEIIFFVLISLIYFLIFNLDGKKILASEHVDGQVNLDLWTFEEIDNSGKTILSDYQIDGNLKEIVIPNAVDFIKSDPTKYKNLGKVYITRKAMNKAAKNGDQEGGSLKISNTGANDSSCEPDQKKVFADGEDWSYTFNGNEHLFSSFFSINYIKEIDLSNFDTSSVTDMAYMFFDCKGLTSLNVSNFNTSSVTNMTGMFFDCKGLTSLNVSNFNTSSVTNMTGMFAECKGLTSLDVSNFNTSSVTNMTGMFADCSNLKQISGVSDFDVSMVYSMDHMFTGCNFKNEINFSSWKPTNVQSMSGMYQNYFGHGDLLLCGFETKKLYARGGLVGGYPPSQVDDGDPQVILVQDGMYDYGENGMFRNSSNLLYLDLSKFNLDNLDQNNQYPYDKIFAIDNEEERQEPLLITANDEFLKTLTTSRDNCQNRTLFTTTLKVDGENVQFRGGDESEFVKYNSDKTEKYINLYESFTTTDSKEEILQKLTDRLEEEKKNLIVVPGYKNIEWEPEKETEGKVSYSLQNVYTIKKVEQEEKNYSWGTIENSGGASSGNSTSSQIQNPVEEIALENNKTFLTTASKIHEELQTRKYLFGYPDGKIRPEGYVTNAEFATVIYRLMNNGEKINYDKLKDIGVEKSDWFADAVAYLIDDSRKIINVTSEKFDPNKNIKGYEMINIIHNVLKFYGVDKDFAVDQDLNSNVTRAEMAKMIFEVFDRKDNLGKKIYSDLDKNHWAYKFLIDASE